MEKDKKYKYLIQRNFEELYNIYYNNKRKIIQKKGNDETRRMMKMIREIIDRKEFNEDELERIKNNNKDYLSYPDIHHPDFVYELSRKAEFFHCKSLLNRIDLDQKCYSKDFELGNHQQFLKAFMNRMTPYNGLLIFHGVGVGKTCSAVTISNSFRDIYKKDDKKIVCLVSKNIQPNWRKTIYDPSKGEDQCTGDTFKHIIGDLDGVVGKGLERKVKRTIKQYYEFYGYQQFANKIKNLVKNKMGNRKDIPIKEVEKSVIKSYFSNRLLIIDEAHNLRDDNLKVNQKNKDGPSKDTIKYLDKVVKYSDNMRLILMSATPMFNKPSEIIWLLNMLLKNDKRVPISIKPKQIFQSDGNLTDYARGIIKQKSKGYISYLRGENPITFPIRIYPDDYNDKLCISDKYPIYDIWNKKYNFNETYQFKFLKMYYNQIRDYQLLIYKEYIKSLSIGQKLQIESTGPGKQISNIVYPSIEILNDEYDEEDDINFSKMYGIEGFNNLIKSKIKNNRRIYEYRKDVPPFFSLEMIHMVSSKIHTILSGLKTRKAKGIIFIYSEFITSGVIPLGLALEHMGFEKYSGNHLKYPEWKKGSKNTKDEPIDYLWNPISKKKREFKRAKYIILSGDTDISPDNENDIKALVSDNNKNGENIKIVIGSVVASEGLDLKNIREIHILDPWYHLYRIEQIIGRGIRFCSHINLPNEERNVTIFLHAACERRNKESIDTYLYRMAEEKANLIGGVEMILKENSIDCYLNKHINMIKPQDILPVKLRTSRRRLLKSFEVHDKKYTKICSFSKTCDYSCGINSIQTKDINYDTFTFNNSKDLLLSIQKIIRELYEINNYYNLNEFEEIITKLIDTNKIIIYYALFNLIDNKITIWNKFKISGYIINKNNYYLFQPHNNNDRNVPLYYRNNKVKDNLTTHIPLKGVINKEKKKKKETEKEQEKQRTIQTSFNDIYNKINKKNKSKLELGKNKYDFHPFISSLNKDIYLDYYIDQLKYQEKIILLKEIVKEYIKTGEIKDKLNQTIFRLFSNNLIKKENEDYHIIESDKYDVVGFFICNTDTFYERKRKNKKELDNIEDNFNYYIFNEQWNEINDLDDGLLIKNNILRNIRKKEISIFNVTKVWGFSFKLENQKHVIKIVNKKFGMNNLPGKIVENIAQRNSIKKIISDEFKDEYKKYNQIISNLTSEDKKYSKLLESKEFLALFIEMILRNKKKKDRYSFIPYDLILFKYLT
ncbi:MAG: hypothetical protein CL470_03865 [Acidimicrobiaceae bacterium]|nr:hypothetical protein [Acidimicrobiaceae bacterium]